MKKFILTAGLIILLSLPNFVSAATDFQTAEMRFICALSSFASYSGDESFLVRSMLTSRGWQIEKLSHKNDLANAKAFLISRNFSDGRQIKVLAIAGTEDIKDAEVDFRVGRTSLNNEEILGDNFTEKIFVHRGFRDYADSVLSDNLGERLIEDLNKNPNETLYITGHSLGGAVAMLTAIRLTDLGVTKDRMKVITFGAPAVGNQKLAENYEDKIDLTRIEISGDLIKKSLKMLGYVHFGYSVQYNPKLSIENNEHQLAIYLDCALREYYKTGGFQALPEIDEKHKLKTPIYVAPLVIVKESFDSDDEEYIKASLIDALKTRLVNLKFSEPPIVKIKDAENFSGDATEFIYPAKKAGCKFILQQVIQAKKIKDALLGNRQVIFEEIIFDTDGYPISLQTSGATTKDLTIIEAAILAQENLRESREKIFEGR